MKPSVLRGLLFLACLVLVGCSRPAPEQVERLSLTGASERLAVADGVETRPAVSLRAPGTRELCVPAAKGATRRIRIGLRSETPGTTAQLDFGSEDTASAPLTPRWQDLVVAAPAAGGCAELRLAGPASLAVQVSTPLLERSGSRRPWVVIYLVDTFRYDELNGPIFAPLAERSLFYRRAFSTSSWTRPAAASILTGLEPSEHGIRGMTDRLSRKLPRLAEAMAAGGYATLAISTNPNVLPRWGFAEGFDRFFDVEVRPGEDFLGGLRRFGAQTAELARSQADRPLFLYVHDNGPHIPYQAPDPLRREVGVAPLQPDEIVMPTAEASAAELAHARAVYRAALRFAGERVGGLLDALNEIGRLEEALVVVVGDHGEEFGEHGGVNHGRTLYQEQLHVPLFLRMPEADGRRGPVDQAVSILDIAPTLAQLAGVEAPTSWQGRSLPLESQRTTAPQTTAAKQEPLVSELSLLGARSEAVIAWPWKLLRGEGPPRLFQLEEDPGETRDRSQQEPELAEGLTRVAEQRRRRARAGLELECVAGLRDTRLELRIELDGPAADVEALSLEAGETAVADARGVTLRSLLSARLEETRRVIGGALGDRDGLRLPTLPGKSLRIVRSGPGPRVLAPDGSTLPVDGTPIELTAIRADAAPDPSPGRLAAQCRLSWLPSHTADAELDPALRARLRELGYLE